jgi:enolase
MRLLVLKEIPVLEIQEPREDGYYLVAMGNTMEMFFDSEKGVFFQYQEGISNKEITAKTKELGAMEDKEEAQKLFEEAKEEWKRLSKKVAYKVIVEGKDFSEQIQEYIKAGISKEYLD